MDDEKGLRNHDENDPQKQSKTRGPACSLLATDPLVFVFSKIDTGFKHFI